MASKGKVADVTAAFDDDTMSLGGLLKKKSRKMSRTASNADWDEGAKHAWVNMASASAAVIPGSQPPPLRKILEVLVCGKSYFFKEFICLEQSLLACQLFGHGELILRSLPSDYGEMLVYSGSSSSGEPDPVKEDTYRIARSLGSDSSARVVCNMDFHLIGFLPNKEASEFDAEYGSSFIALEVAL